LLEFHLIPDTGFCLLGFRASGCGDLFGLLGAGKPALVLGQDLS
jgi:hypothetical protein